MTPRVSSPADRRPKPDRAPASEVQQRLAYERTFLANERTYAAWLRTGLAVAGGGVAAAHLVPAPSCDAWVALGLGSAFVAVGAGLMTYGARRFARTADALARASGRAAPVSARLPHLPSAVIAGLLLAVLLLLWTQQGRAADRVYCWVPDRDGGERAGLLGGVGGAWARLTPRW